MVAAAVEAATSGKGLANLKARLTNIAIGGHVPLDQVHRVAAEGFSKAVNQILTSQSISPDHENRLLAFMKENDLDTAELDSDGSYSRMLKGCIISDLLSGKYQSRLSFNGSLPFHFQSGEIVLWVFNGCKYLAEKVHRSYVGGSHGVSFRITRGVYYRMGSFRGHPVETTSLDAIDSGSLVVTQKNLYFGGSKTSFRIPLSKIVTIVPYSNGFGIFRDRVNAKREVFTVDDPWFAHNLLAHLSPA